MSDVTPGGATEPPGWAPSPAPAAAAGAVPRTSATGPDLQASGSRAAGASGPNPQASGSRAAGASGPNPQASESRAVGASGPNPQASGSRAVGAPGPGAPRPGTGPGASPSGPRPRPRRHARRWRLALVVLAAFAIVAGAGWALLGSRLLVLRSVTVTGTHLVSAAQVIAVADVPPGTPLLRVDTGAVARRVESIPQVASARVTKGWPDHLLIAVTERVPVLAVKLARGGYDLVDPSGVPVRWAKERPAALPRLLTPLSGSALAGAPSVSAAAGVLAELQPWLARQVAQMSAAQATGSSDPAGLQVTLRLDNGKTVLWGAPGRAAQKNREIAIMLAGQARYIDVSAPGTVVTR